MRGPQPEKVAEKPAEEEPHMLILLPPPVSPPSDAPPADGAENPPGTVALVGAPSDGAPLPIEGAPPAGPTDPNNPDAAGPAPEAAPAIHESLFAGALMDPQEEAARAAAAAEVQAQQEAAMADLEAKASSSTQVAEAPPVAQVNIGDYAAKAVSFLARNFYTLKYVALVLAFCINFVLLFYKVLKRFQVTYILRFTAGFQCHPLVDS